MSPREWAARALGVRSGAIESVEEIKHGLTNESWLVRTTSEAVVVRISSRHSASLQIDRMTEAVVLRTVATAQIGPPVLHYDVERGVLVTRYLGPTCTSEQMSAPDYIERLGHAFSSLHTLALPREVRTVHLPTVIAGYESTLRTFGRQSDWTKSATSARALAAEISQSSTPRLCHNDVHSLNVVEGDRLRLLDWEYAGIGEPFFDLASVCVYHDYTLGQRERLLQAYLDAPTSAALERLEKCCWLFAYVRDLWAEVRSAVAERASH